MFFIRIVAYSRLSSIIKRITCTSLISLNFEINVKASFLSAKRTIIKKAVQRFKIGDN